MNLVDGNQPGQLRLDLLDHHRRARGDDRDARQFILRVHTGRRSGFRCCSHGPRTGRRTRARMPGSLSTSTAIVWKRTFSLGAVTGVLAKRGKSKGETAGRGQTNYHAVFIAPAGADGLLAGPEQHLVMGRARGNHRKTFSVGSTRQSTIIGLGEAIIFLIVSSTWPGLVDAHAPPRRRLRRDARNQAATTNSFPSSGLRIEAPATGAPCPYTGCSG